MKFESPSIYKDKNISISFFLIYFHIYLDIHYQNYQDNSLSRISSLIIYILRNKLNSGGAMFRQAQTSVWA
jgi:hypothetical protein